MNKKRYLCLISIFVLCFTGLIFAQTAELEVNSVFNNEFAKVKDKIKTAKDTVITLKLANNDKSEIGFHIPKGSKVVSVFLDGEASEKIKGKDGYIKVGVTAGKTKEVVVTTRKIDDPVYTDSKVPLWDIKKRVGKFAFEFPVPDIQVGTATFKLSDPKNLCFISEEKYKLLQDEYNKLIGYKNNILIGIGVIALILIKFIFRYIGRIFKMIAWFICWPAKRVKPAGFVVLFLMFGGAGYYAYNSFLPTLQNQLPSNFDERDCEKVRSEYDSAISNNKDAGTKDDLQSLFEKGVVKKVSGCPQFGFYAYDDSKINCTVHSKGNNKSKLLHYQVKLPKTIFSDTMKVTSVRMASPIRKTFYYVDKAVFYISAALFTLISFFFFFIPVILGKKLDASYAKLFRKKGQGQAQPQQRGGMRF